MAQRQSESEEGLMIDQINSESTIPNDYSIYYNYVHNTPILFGYFLVHAIHAWALIILRFTTKASNEANLKVQGKYIMHPSI